MTKWDECNHLPSIDKDVSNKDGITKGLHDDLTFRCPDLVIKSGSLVV